MAKPGGLWAVAVAAASCATMGGLAGACSASGDRGEKAVAVSSTTGTGGHAGSGGAGVGGTSLVGVGGGGPPPADAGGLCGNQIEQIITDAPNLYFVLDASGSMAEMASGGFTRYQLLQHGAVLMIESLGSLINIGAAVFPLGASQSNACQVGEEVFPVTPGDPVSPMLGPTTEGFTLATSITPSGGTPTAATLTALTPGLKKLKGRTVVLLATDGGPNCDAAIMCDVSQCIPNIEGTCLPMGSNCCAPGGTIGPTGCLDQDASVAAVGALASAGIPVIVIGIPGSEIYADVLGAMSMAGNGIQSPSGPYWAVTDYTALEQVFAQIASAYISCDFTLKTPPPDQFHTNVYFDQTVVPQDPMNGWVWKSPSEIELTGSSCAALKAGKVMQVQIVSGCPTVTT